MLKLNWLHLDSIIVPFVWAYKSPHMSEAHLQRTWAERGLGLPEFLSLLLGL